LTRLFRQIFFNAYSLGALLFLTIQQAIVASSTFFIVKLNEAVIMQRKSEALLLLGLFFGSLTVVYIPAVSYDMLFTKAENFGFRCYTVSITKRLFNQPYIEGNKKLKERYGAWIIAESERVISQSYRLLFDILVLVLNISFNIAAIAVVHSYFLRACFVSMVVTCLHHALFRRLIARVTHVKLQAWQNYRNVLNKALKNTVLGNAYHRQKWRTRYFNTWRHLRGALLKSKSITHYASMQSTVLGIAPIIATSFFLFYQTNTWHVLSGIVVTLPRQVQIIQNMYELSVCLSEVPMVRTALKALSSSLVPPVNDLHTLIKWDKIAINGVSVSSYLEVLKMADVPNRYRITGENGSGKTSLLLQLKADLGQKAIYIPASPEDLEPCIQGSTGQIMRQQLQQTLRLPCQCILLDEWNAPLDHRMTPMIDNKITAVAKSKAIFEVIHHKA
jgi:hypothetical protein